LTDDVSKQACTLGSPVFQDVPTVIAECVRISPIILIQSYKQEVQPGQGLKPDKGDSFLKVSSEWMGQGCAVMGEGLVIEFFLVSKRPGLIVLQLQVKMGNFKCIDVLIPQLQSMFVSAGVFSVYFEKLFEDKFVQSKLTVKLHGRIEVPFKVRSQHHFVRRAQLMLHPSIKDNVV